ncbi:YbgA family protein [Candidatus Chrysopegis kryptomonas]|jgi:uncharacterized protein YbbK (DUF523 family)/uncharacterized protein YbgA (DUF1722 family)|uniref:Uncharacterized conserved protein YbbK, DUF523 family n=1 Tax=Candidatus Chryseopegocella kryptomonas TaxID=1633643 RepID=A0A0N7MYR1_9BACT|nr:DUF523 and DUF1722 domain-containing protein [Candidatus Chrysopegis kryptomonas]CUT04947.1 Uncharacterized conserved protein YbbK, DUF523 family [Candidatus Chrysopegis kryptomonas]
MKPTVVISACLDGFAYRYNGFSVNDEIVDRIKSLFNLVHVCPEVGIGLGVPRKTIKLQKVKNSIRAIQDETGIDLTDELEKFAKNFLNELGQVHGFILKAKSPSCGVGSAKVYYKDNPYGKSYGIFAGIVNEHFPFIPMIDEGRLRNKQMMWEFLTKVFMFYRFTEAKKSINDLIEFHSKHKYLIMSLSQKHLKMLGKIIASHDGKNFESVVQKYDEIFKDLMMKNFRKSNIANVLIHIFGHFSENLSGREKSHFLKMVQKYREDKLELSGLVEILRSYALRFEDEYILGQYFLEPFPDAG